jgi:PhnB protein
MKVSSLYPMLTVRGAMAAVEFYGKAFGATAGQVFNSADGKAVAQMFLDGFEFYAVDENPPAQNMSPQSLGGTTVRLNLIVDDPDALAAQAVAAGATELFPVADQPYGMRQGRVVDPYGHHWLIGKRLS